MIPAKNYYQILDLYSAATHDEIKHAFRQHAMALHPDRHPNRRDAEELFKIVVEAYETLSDIHKRAVYDLRVLEIRPIAFDQGLTPKDLARAQTKSILNTPVDDTLEELVVGNELPADATLGTLFRDLERTENFILMRDGKEAFFTRQFTKAIVIFCHAEEQNPRNILILYYLGRSYFALGRLLEAEKLLRQALQLGESRHPPNHCPGVRRALLEVYRRRGKNMRARWLERENRMLSSMDIDVTQQTIAETNRAMARLLAEQLARDAERAASQPRKRISA